tara:strand:+ start:313 stop:543 length:231 start_codon:yes stop_codon:yes gene_type:complete
MVLPLILHQQITQQATIRCIAQSQSNQRLFLGLRIPEGISHNNEGEPRESNLLGFTFLVQISPTVKPKAIMRELVG